MASITLENIHLSYPLLTNQRSLRAKLVRSLQSNRMELDEHKRIVVNALQNVNLTFTDGDRVGLIGTNGAGKSTLLRVLAGIYVPNSGKCTIQGRIASMLSMGVGLRDNVTGFENIRLGCLLLDMTQKEIEDKTDSIAEFTGLGDHIYLPINTYSMGMRTRLAFGIATSLDPDILLIDEVIGAGDQTFIKKAEARIDELVKRSSIMVLASHSNATIRQFCNKALWMDKGNVKAFGAMEDVVSQYEAELAYA